jgi:polyketide cyclase/dehydrase/lipid transport protein
MPIKWPEKYHPSCTSVHVSNSLSVTIKPELLWAWMIRAPLWPTWYPNSSNVVFLDSTGQDLQKGTRFRWKTFGVTIESEVKEFEPCERLAWSAVGIGVDAYHAWLFEPKPAACNMLTEETQNGFLAKLGSMTMPNRMHKYHQIWLETLRDQARAGMPA